MVGHFWHYALVYLAAALITVPLTKRLGLGSVLGYLLGGAVIGPSVLNLVGSQEEVMKFAEIGVVIMLFVIGLELDLKKLWTLRMPIFGLGSSQVTLSALGIAAVLMFFEISWQASLALGATFALSSTAIALQSLEEKGMLGSGAGQSSFAVLLFQDMAVIPLLALFPLLATHAVPESVSHAQHHIGTGLRAVAIIAAVGGIIVGGRFLAKPVFRLIAETRLREIFTVLALAIVIGITVAMEEVGLSPALGTFLGGLVLASSEYRHELEATIEPFKGLLLGLFFMAIGASLNIGLIVSAPVMMASAVICLVVFKAVVLFGLGAVFKIDLAQRFLFTIVLAQAGEFGFVLLSFASKSGILSPELSSGAIAVIAISMFLTPVLLVINERYIQPRFLTRVPQREPDKLPDETREVIIAGYGRFGQIVSRLLTANGFSTTLLDHNPSQIEAVGKFGTKVFYGDATRLDLLAAAGAKHASLLVIAIDDKDAAIELVESVRKHYPTLPIVVRAVDRRHAFELLALGVKHVYRETFSSALDMGVEALSILGMRRHQAFRLGRIFKQHDELALQQLYERYAQDEESDFIEEAKRRLDNIVKIIEKDRSDPEMRIDQGWQAAPRAER